MASFLLNWHIIHSKPYYDEIIINLPKYYVFDRSESTRKSQKYDVCFKTINSINKKEFLKRTLI